MKYFVSYAEVFSGNDAIKKETFRLQTYNMLIHFLSRKEIPDNMLSYEFKKMKGYFESKEFTDVYFLSPFVFNENAFAKDIMNVITSSGETNRYNRVMDEVKDEVKSIKVGRNFYACKRIIAANADEYLSIYLANPRSIDQLDLSSSKERQVVITNANEGYKRGDEILSVLRLKLLIKFADSIVNIKEAIKEGEELYISHPQDADLTFTIASAYNNQYYQEKDKGENVFKWLKKSADLEDACSLYLLGLLYFMGEGVKKDPQQALNCWKKASEKGNSDADSGIGVYYLSKGQKDLAKPYLEKTAAKGDFKAMLLLDTDFDRK